VTLSPWSLADLRLPEALWSAVAAAEVNLTQYQLVLGAKPIIIL
jgi:hypothetical protein